MEEQIIGNKLELSTFRVYYSDGIMDLAFGSMLVISAINSWLDLNQVETSIFMRILVIPVVIILVAFKVFYTQKRMGHVKFRPSRNRKRLNAILVAIAAVIFTSVLYYLTSSGKMTTEDKNSMIPLIIEFTLLVGIFSLLAFYTDFYNFYIVGLAMGLGSPMARLFEPLTGTRIYGYIIMFMAGLALIIFGITQLVIFLLRYPKTSKDEE